MSDGTPLARAAVALGANLGDRRATLERAVALLAEEVGPLAARSAWRETPALIHPDDPAAWYPPYLNGVVVLRTALEPAAILTRLQAIELALGRDRRAEQARWRPRVIDLDLIAIEERIVLLPDLAVPHPEMHRRDFVLGPMAEVWPDWRHPRLGRTVEELLAALDQPAPAG